MDQRGRNGGGSGAEAKVNLSLADRVHQVYKWILDGASDHEVAEAIRANWPNVDAQPLIVKATLELQRNSTADPAVIKGWCIEATRRVYQKAVEVQDHQTALRAIKMLSELV